MSANRSAELIATLRRAERADIPAMHRVRLSVIENRLASIVTEDDYIPAIEETGRGWVVELVEWSYQKAFDSLSRTRQIAIRSSDVSVLLDPSG